MQDDESLWREMEKKYAFKTIIFSHTDMTPWGRKFITRILKDPGWQLDYFDSFGMILTKKKVLIGETINSNLTLEQKKLSVRIQEEINTINPDPVERRYWENFLNLVRMSESGIQSSNILH